MNRFKRYIQLFSNMGLRYISFRSFYEIQRKSGLFKRHFPTTPPIAHSLSLEKWRKKAEPFFFQSREELRFSKEKNKELQEEVKNIFQGKIRFFNYQFCDLGTDYDWTTNPQTGFTYDKNKHWTEINDFDSDAGDIKYVWEKSRFSYLYSVLRYDYHFEEDHSQFVFSEIESWIANNPINNGPNYKCSQEISIRILNWIFFLYFYKYSPSLTDELFQKIMHGIYWQLHHVYHNIHFSRVTVRNNHAITETLVLYIVSTLFPDFQHATQWRKMGKKWFEQEIAYQIYPDGTYLQFSMNYHRVVIQLLTWAIKIAELNNDSFQDIVYEQAYKSVNFLYQCQEDSNGKLPNYGSNDGALFFKLSGNDYQDYRPQLDALHILLTGKSLYKHSQEDILWYGRGTSFRYTPIEKKYGIITFKNGGYYLIREKESFTFIRCGKYKDRPAHADNLHIDIWCKGENILPDGGTYRYNAEKEAIKYFMGTESHNTIMLGDYDQMLKGVRFIWYDWTQAQDIMVDETDVSYVFLGTIHCFTHLDKKIMHTRKVTKWKEKLEWDIEDIVTEKPDQLPMKQIWHFLPKNYIRFESDSNRIEETGCYSSYYGEKKEIRQTIFQTNQNVIRTHISIDI